jgi:hypothetical protein
MVAGTSRQLNNRRMEKWNCPHCGEEMLGAVNRCWSCGQRVSQPVEAVIMAEPAALASVEVDAEEAEQEFTAEDIALALHQEPPRRGSPFARMAELAEPNPFAPRYGEGPYRAGHTPATAGVLPERGPAPTAYPRNAGAIGGVVAALVLGVLSLAAAWFTVFAFITAMVGIGLGIWGLKTDRKTLAMAALLLCALAVLVTGFFFALTVYQFVTGAGGTRGAGSW